MASRHARDPALRGRVPPPVRAGPRARLDASVRRAGGGRGRGGARAAGRRHDELHLPRPRRGPGDGRAAGPHVRRDPGQGRRPLRRQGRVHAPDRHGRRRASARSPSSARTCRSASAPRSPPATARPARSACASSATAPRTSAPSTRRSTSRRSGRCRSSSSARTTSTASTRRSPGRRRSSASPTACGAYGDARRADRRQRRARGPRRRREAPRARAPARARRFIEALTYRQRGHSRSDPAAYRPAGELERWLERDPILLHERALAGAGVPRERLVAIARRGRAGRRRRPRARAGLPRPRSRRRGSSTSSRDRGRRTGRPSTARSRTSSRPTTTSSCSARTWRPPAGCSRPPRGCQARFGARSRARHADLRAGDRRDGDRRRGPGPAAAGRDHVRRLRGRLLRPDRQPAGQVPVHDRRAGAAAGHDPARQRRRHRLRRPALAAGRELVPQRAGAQARHAGHAGRRLRRCCAPRSAITTRSWSSSTRGCSTSRARWSDGPRRRSGRAEVVRARRRRHRGRDPAHAPPRLEAAERAGRGGDRGRADRSADAGAVRLRDGAARAWSGPTASSSCRRRRSPAAGARRSPRG